MFNQCRAKQSVRFGQGWIWVWSCSGRSTVDNGCQEDLGGAGLRLKSTLCCLSDTMLSEYGTVISCVQKLSIEPTDLMPLKLRTRLEIRDPRRRAAALRQMGEGVGCHDTTRLQAGSLNFG